MHSSSTMFTIGTALRRAEDNHLSVEVLVNGQWLHGNIAGLDGEGLVLSTHAEHAVVRLSAISAVRIPESMTETSVAEAFDEQRQLASVAREDDGSFAMPSARV
jgi:hypothetical protein